MYSSFSYESYGLPHQVLRLKEKCQPSLQPQELLVKMLYAPVNPSDLIPMTGAYAHRISLPATAGYEGLVLSQMLAAHFRANLSVNVFYPWKGKALGKLLSNALYLMHFCS